MLHPSTKRWVHSSASRLLQTQLPKPTRSLPKRVEEKKETQQPSPNAKNPVKRNELGVQLLSRPLHAQIFRTTSFPPPPKQHVSISLEHLALHSLSPADSSSLPDTSFVLPQLTAPTLDEHFHRIGEQSAQPWLGMARGFADLDLPPKPEAWNLSIPGWTRYDSDGCWEHVPFPQTSSGQPEDKLVFDVETLPHYHPYAIMAIAASPTSWYSWISPWLLDNSLHPSQLIPLGSPETPRIVVGHNVSYDRARLADEYTLHGTGTRFLDTMALHVAGSGISSHQRPAWMAHRKKKGEEEGRKRETAETIRVIIKLLEQQSSSLGENTARRDRLEALKRDLEESLDAPAPPPASADLEEEGEAKRWEDITSANSLADVARLHCSITLPKQTRNDFLTSTPGSIVSSLDTYLDYCARDVEVTHLVFKKTLPQFLGLCPSPVSFAGILTMGSSFLTVDEGWVQYLEQAEKCYRDLEGGVKTKLVELAEEARGMFEDEERWKDDVWLSQLDWSGKNAGKSRGVGAAPVLKEGDPAWYTTLLADPLSKHSVNNVLPLLLRLTLDGSPIVYSPSMRWHYLEDGEPTPLPSAKEGKKVMKVLGKEHALPFILSGRMSCVDDDLAIRLVKGEMGKELEKKVKALAEGVLKRGEDPADPQLSSLDWSCGKKEKGEAVIWPKWYWDQTKPRKGLPPGTLDITVRNRIAPLLLRLTWLGHPLFHSKEHGWIFRVSPSSTSFTTRLSPLEFYDPADASLEGQKQSEGYRFYKLPHKDGDSANVGSPLSKGFMAYFDDGTLKSESPGDLGKQALEMNSQCSYWISARDRILNQMVVWEKEDGGMGFPKKVGEGEKRGIIIPQVITMGTVTRRAIEKTWLTASNAKKNRVGSELKAMVRAPPGYAIVGADVDSEELWISSAMGDAQFGMHGATAIGWMTLEGTKAAGTDLHSKTASILGISRDQAKVFNYSRIYGAGMKHAVLLLLQNSPGMSPEEAQKLAENLYASTKGKNTHRADLFGKKFWFGGTESFVFNKLEEIALSDRAMTPALGCGVTHALSKAHLPAGFGTDYMTSRINWVVQSSGVDYLHLLIVGMDYLVQKYGIQARYLISVHDELRYLVKEEDRYRAALALQIANVWTRSLFAYRLGMDDLPQGIAFFSAVDVDTVLRKEPHMTCVTPSQPIPIPPGESLDIAQILSKTNGGSLFPDGSPMPLDDRTAQLPPVPGYKEPNCLLHRADTPAWLQAQATQDFGEIKYQASRVSGQQYVGGIGAGSRKRGRKSTPIADCRKIDWEDAVDELLRTHGQMLTEDTT